MENNKYTSNHPGKGMNMRGPGMHRGSGEKARDFTGTWKKLIIYCKRYLIPTVIAVICAIGGTIFTLIGPDKLSDMTEVITRGTCRQC